MRQREEERGGREREREISGGGGGVHRLRNKVYRWIISSFLSHRGEVTLASFRRSEESQVPLFPTARIMSGLEVCGGE